MARILVVDDEECIRASIAAMLRCAGHIVVLAEDGEDALRKFAPSRYDLVITDIVMPHVEGIETVLALRRRAPMVRIIAMSDGDGPDRGFYLKAALALGADPFTVSDLRLIVDEALALPESKIAALWYREMPDWTSPVQRTSRPVESASNAARSSAPK